MKSDAIGPQGTMASAAKQATAKPQETLLALTIVRREGKYVILELTIAGGQVVTQRQVDAQYYRDLAEDSAMRWLRKSGR